MNKTIDIIVDFGKSCTEKIANAYEHSHSMYPKTTNYLSSAVGTIGGDFIAKYFGQNQNYKIRDVIFTASAAAVYSYLAPKMIEWSKNISSKISNQTIALTAMYFPVNMLYWNYLTIKNESPITFEDNIAGAITLGIATIPYLWADYIAIKKFSDKTTEKYLRPFYSSVELLWNTLFATGNYISKKF